MMKAYTAATNLTLHNVRYISSRAFENCTKLTSVDLDGCEYLGGNAFSGCTNLTDIVVPDYIRLGYSDIFRKFSGYYGTYGSNFRWTV